MPAVVFQPWPMHRRRRLAREFVEDAGDLLLDSAERREDFGHTLAGEILKIASFENGNHAIPNVLGEPLLGVLP